MRSLGRGREPVGAVAIFMVAALAALAGAAGAQQSRVFVTDTGYEGNLGGLAGADAICQAQGNAVYPGTFWVAWLSTSTVDAVDRLTASGPFVRASDPSTIIADDIADLTDGSLDNPVALSTNRQRNSQGYAPQIAGARGCQSGAQAC